MERKLLPPSVHVTRRKGAAAIRKWLVVQAAAAGEPRVAELGKHRIMEMTGLPTRDLRVLDPDLDSPSTILGREHAVIVNLEHVKIIVTAAEALVLDSSNPLLVPFLKSLHTRLSSPDVSSTSSATDRSKETDQGNVDIPPFEFKVLEVCLEHTCKCLESELPQQEPPQSGQLEGGCGKHDTEARTPNVQWSAYLYCVEHMEGKK